jgi:hypothetical protein
VKSFDTAALSRIRAKLVKLRKLDAACVLFGASSHRYRLGPPLAESTVAKQENRLGLPLPAEYRHFVMEVGHGGAGPSYGLFRLDGSDPEDITNLEKIRKPFRWAEALNPVEWENPRTEDDVWVDEGVDEGEKPRVFLDVPGSLYVCHHGCALRFFLIVNGVGLGEVWKDRQADNEGLTPECGEDGHRLTFLQWYESWLDEGISTLEKG